ncbi:MAG: hypothetical protein FWC00_06005 [Firmicutes bacterium]|nr:hypothetical protein [Bacillota bacterium]
MRALENIIKTEFGNNPYFATEYAEIAHFEMASQRNDDYEQAVSAEIEIYRGKLERIMAIVENGNGELFLEFARRKGNVYWSPENQKMFRAAWARYNHHHIVETEDERMEIIYRALEDFFPQKYKAGYFDMSESDQKNYEENILQWDVLLEKLEKQFQELNIKKDRILKSVPRELVDKEANKVESDINFTYEDMKGEIDDVKNGVLKTDVNDYRAFMDREFSRLNDALDIYGFVAHESRALYETLPGDLEESNREYIKGIEELYKLDGVPMDIKRLASQIGRTNGLKEYTLA